MLNRARSLGCFGSLALVVLSAMCAGAQVAPGEYDAAPKPSSGINLGSNGDVSQTITYATLPELFASNELSDSKVPDPIASPVNDGINLDRRAEAPTAPCGTKSQTIQVVANPPSNQAPPTTLTVRTAALLELHAMRQNAVDLCLQLPAKYRTELPQCADIMKGEIRLEQLAKESKKQ